MTDDISKLEAERAATREQRDAYRREHGWAPGDERLQELDAAVTAADRSAWQAKQAQSQRLAALSPSEWEAHKRAFLADAEHEAWLKRQVVK